ncbi:MAG: chloride channel protein [Armatimonadetes bacterium]|nr:chloride channel protein [Candidatus Hippobium faecium]
MKITDNLKEYKNLILPALIGIPIGIAVGIIDTVFAKGLLAVTALREHHLFWFLPFLPFAGILIIYVRNIIKKKEGFGINLIFAVGLGEETRIPLRLIPFVIISTWLTHLFGGSAGREGVALQIGGAVADRLGRKIPIKTGEDIFLIAGLAAGFAGLFLTPIGAVLFAVEVLIVGKIEYRAFLPALGAAFSATLTSRFLGLEKWTYDLNCRLAFNFGDTLKIIWLGIIFGMAGSLFIFILRRMKTYSEKYIPNPLWRIFIISIALGIIMILTHGRYCGVGSDLIETVFSGGNIFAYDWILKLILTAITLSIGFQGGEIMPLFSIGACLGFILAPFFGLPGDFVAALGFAALFGSATNTFFAPIFIGAEIFGFASLPYFFTVCAIAYFCNLNRSIYAKQKTE